MTNREWIDGLPNWSFTEWLLSEEYFTMFYGTIAQPSPKLDTLKKVEKDDEYKRLFLCDWLSKERVAPNDAQQECYEMERRKVFYETPEKDKILGIVKRVLLYSYTNRDIFNRAYEEGWITKEEHRIAQGWLMKEEVKSKDD